MPFVCIKFLSWLTAVDWIIIVCIYNISFPMFYKLSLTWEQGPSPPKKLINLSKTTKFETVDVPLKGTLGTCCGEGNPYSLGVYDACLCQVGLILEQVHISMWWVHQDVLYQRVRPKWCTTFYLYVLQGWLRYIPSFNFCSSKFPYTF